MPKKNNSYWEERVRQNKLKSINVGEGAINELKRILKTNLDDVQKEITNFYDKYGNNPAEKLSYKEFEQYKKDLKAKVKKYPEDKTLQKIAKQDIPKYRIDRLRQLETDLQIRLAEVTKYQQTSINGTLKDVAAVSHEATKKMMKEAIGLDIGAINSKQIEALIFQDRSGKNWSERLWTDREKLGKKLKQTLEKGITQGIGSRKMARELKKEMGTSFNNAFRLIRTESAFIQESITQTSYRHAAKELGLEYYKYDAFLDGRTSDICRELDGKRFKISEMQIGVNAPPMHPNCRSTTQLVLDEVTKEKEVNKVHIKKKTTQKEEKNVLTKEGKQKKDSKIPNEFVNAKNYKEAEKFAQHLGIKTVEYKGLDLATANRMNKVFAEYKKDYPEIIQDMKYAGSMQNLTKYAKNKIFTRDFCLQQLIKTNPYINFKNLEAKTLEKYISKQQNHYIKLAGYQVKTTARAVSRYDKYFKGITFNNKEKYIETIKNRAIEISKNYKPKGTASIEGTIHHELGHQLDYLLKLRENKEIQNLYNSLSHKEITDQLSIYAWNNTNKNPYGEFIAEAWSEYKTAHNPRELARKVGEIVEKEYNKFKH